MYINWIFVIFIILVLASFLIILFNVFTIKQYDISSNTLYESIPTVLPSIEYCNKECNDYIEFSKFVSGKSLDKNKDDYRFAYFKKFNNIKSITECKKLCNNYENCQLWNYHKNNNNLGETILLYKDSCYWISGIKNCKKCIKNIKFLNKNNEYKNIYKTIYHNYNTTKNECLLNF